MLPISFGPPVNPAALSNALRIEGCTEARAVPNDVLGTDRSWQVCGVISTGAGFMLPFSGGDVGALALERVYSAPPIIIRLAGGRLIF